MYCANMQQFVYDKCCANMFNIFMVTYFWGNQKLKFRESFCFGEEA